MVATVTTVIFAVRTKRSIKLPYRLTSPVNWNPSRLASSLIMWSERGCARQTVTSTCPSPARRRPAKSFLTEEIPPAVLWKRANTRSNATHSITAAKSKPPISVPCQLLLNQAILDGDPGKPDIAPSTSSQTADRTSPLRHPVPPSTHPVQIEQTPPHQHVDHGNSKWKRKKNQAYRSCGRELACRPATCSENENGNSGRKNRRNRQKEQRPPGPPGKFQIECPCVHARRTCGQRERRGDSESPS